MPRSTAKFRIGEFFLAQRSNSSSWCACWFDKRSGQTRRASLGTTCFEQAKRELAEFAVLHEHLHKVPVSRVRIADVLLRYFDQHAYALPSAEAINFHIGKWLEYFDDSMVGNLMPAVQDEFLKHLVQQGYSHGYIRRILGTGRAALQRAHKRQELDSVPFIQMPAKRAPQRQAPKLSTEQMAALLQSAHAVSDRLFLFCLIGVTTLARPSAIYDLTAAQVHFDDRFIDLNVPGREQTKKYRPVVPLTSTLLPWLREAVNASESGHLIEYRGAPVKSLKKGFRQAVNGAGLPSNVTAYSIRHTMARELRRRGVDAWEVAGLMGHKVRDTTEIYAEYDPDYLSKAAGAIDSYCQEMQQFVGNGLIINLAGLRATNVRAG